MQCKLKCKMQQFLQDCSFRLRHAEIFFLVGFIIINLLGSIVMMKPTNVTAGVILTVDTDLPYDFNVVAPALDLAYQHALRDYNVRISQRTYLYEGGCSRSKAVANTFLAANDSVDFIIGPGCTDDMMMSLEPQTYFLMPSVTGAGDLVDSTAKFPFLTRCSYNTNTQWIFVVRLCIKYRWTNVAVIYDSEDATKSLNAHSLRKNLRDHSFRSLDLPFSSEQCGGISDAKDLLVESHREARVVVLLMKGLLLRTFMLAARQCGYTAGDHVFITLDLFRDDVLGHNGWRQNQLGDSAALDAYKSLLVLSLRDTEQEPRYQNFVEQVRARAKQKFSRHTFVVNYYVASFYDSVMLYAYSINKTVREKHLAQGNLTNSLDTDSLSTVLKLSQKMWNRTFPGATGLVYINPDGDRNDDHAIYDMSPNGTFFVAAEFFGYKEIWVQNYTFDQRTGFLWNNPRNLPPRSEPFCWYNGNNPECDTSKQTLGLVLVVALLCIATAFLYVYVAVRRRGRKQERQVLNLFCSWHEVTGARLARNFASEVSADACSVKSLQCGVISDIAPEEIVEYYNQTVEAMYRGRRVLVRLCEPQNLQVTKTILNEAKLVRTVIGENILEMTAISTGPERTAVLYNHCSKGSISDLLSADLIQLDWFFRFSLINDMASGIEVLHRSALGYHGRLTSCCCFVDGHFMVKISDYGLPTLFSKYFLQDSVFDVALLMMWTAPELLNSSSNVGSQEGDIYSLSCIMQQIIMGHPRPFAHLANMEPEVILEKLRRGKLNRKLRPIANVNMCPPEIAVLVKQCWAANPMERPRIAQVKSVLREVHRGSSEQGSTLDMLIQRIEIYTEDLEKIVQEKTMLLAAEKEKTEQLLYEILPRAVAEQLLSFESVLPESYPSCSVLYSDIVGFTALASASSPVEIVDFLNSLYTAFDLCIAKFDAYKIETVGDSYVVASGVPKQNVVHATELCRLSLSLLETTARFKIAHTPEKQLRMRLGVHSGPVVAGVVGLKMPRYCLFGETVIIAAKMESTSLPMKIHLSEYCVKCIDNSATRFEIEKRDGVVVINQKLAIQTFWLLRELSPTNPNFHPLKPSAGE